MKTTKLRWHRQRPNRNKSAIAVRRLLLLALCLPAMQPAMSVAQDQERWFQIEVSIFTNENAADRNEEYWSSEQLDLSYPRRIRRLSTLLGALFSPTLLPVEPATDESRPFAGGISATAEPQLNQQQQWRALIAETGPFPPTAGDSYRLPDLERDAFWRLPDSQSDFQQTNRAIERSAEHRLLYHALWRQPVRQANASSPLYIEAGQQYDGQSELQGSLGIYFNRNEDRVVIDANLWLVEFTSLPDNADEWQLPGRPDSLSALPWDVSEESNFAVGNSRYQPRRIFQMRQAREMRSTEFHYLDHPAMGIVVSVEPYEVPELPEPELPEQDADFGGAQ